MEIKWLEDFVALVDQRSFTRAAEKRHVTQPAFSRRIRSLENWLGVELVDRNSYPIQLTAAGGEFSRSVGELLASTYALREQVRAKDAQSGALVLSTSHSLSVAWCPQWFRDLGETVAGTSIRVNAGDLLDSVDQFLAGRSNMLLCYETAAVSPALAAEDLLKLRIGSDLLVPVCSTGMLQRLQQREPGEAMPLVAYPEESFFGRLIQAHCMDSPKVSQLKLLPVVETALSEGAHAMVRADTGIAWLPAGLVRGDLENGRLAQLTDLPTVTLDINFYIHRNNSNRLVAAIMNRLRSIYSTSSTG